MNGSFFERLFDRDTGRVLDVIAACSSNESDAPATEERLEDLGLSDEQLHNSLSKLLNWEIIRQYHPTDKPVFWEMNGCSQMGRAFEHIQYLQDTAPKACAPPA